MGSLEPVRGGIGQVRQAVAGQIANIDVDDLKGRGGQLAGLAQEHGARYGRLAIKHGGRAAALAQKHGPRYADLAWRQGSQYAGAARRSIEQRIRPQPKPRRWPWALAALGVAAAVGAAVGYLVYDRERRELVRGGMGRLQQSAGRFQQGARQRYAELGGVSGAVGKVRGRVQAGDLDEAALEARAKAAIAAEGQPPAELRVSVEGRTVYLRGTVEDPAWVDAAVERIHDVDGVVAVVNLTTAPARTGS